MAGSVETQNLEPPDAVVCLLSLSLRLLVLSHTSAFSMRSRATQLKSTINSWDGELSDEDEALIRMIRGPAGTATPRLQPKGIFVILDTTGVTSNFNGCDTYTSYLVEDDDDEEGCINLTTRMFPFVKTEDEIASKSAL